jgi:hypothetical protein
VIRNKHWLAVRVTSGNTDLLIFAKAGVNLNLTRIHMGEFTVLQNVWGGPVVPASLFRVLVNSNAVVGVVAVGENEFTSRPDA